MSEGQELYAPPPRSVSFSSFPQFYIEYKDLFLYVWVRAGVFHVLYAAENVVQYLLCLLAFIYVCPIAMNGRGVHFYSQLYWWLFILILFYKYNLTS